MANSAPSQYAVQIGYPDDQAALWTAPGITKQEALETARLWRAQGLPAVAIRLDGRHRMKIEQGPPRS